MSTLSTARSPRIGNASKVRTDGAPLACAETVLTSEALFAGRHQIVIAHAGQRYSLRITQNNKLILTK